MRFKSRWLLRAALAAAVAWAGTGPAGAQAPKPWRHGVNEPKGDSGFSYMVGNGGFAARRGLKVEIIAFNNGATLHKALLAGELDSIESSPGAAILAGARGADLKIVGCDWIGVPQGVMVRANIATIRDLKGKTIASAAPGSLPDLVIRAMLEKYGMSAKDVQLANMGGDAERYKALLAGVADAGVIAAEFLSTAPKDVRIIAAAHEVMPDYVRLCLTMTGKTLTERRGDAINFVAAEIEALRYAVAHRAETIRLTRQIIGVKPDDPRPGFAFDYTIKNNLIAPDVPLPMDRLGWMQDQLIKTGNLDKPIDLVRITDADARAKAAALARR